MIDGAVFLLQQTLSQSNVTPFDRMVLELAGQRVMGRFILGGDKHTRSILVQPMDNPRTQLTTNACQVLTMAQEGIDQGSTMMARGRVYNHSGRFVNNNQMGVFI